MDWAIHGGSLLLLLLLFIGLDLCSVDRGGFGAVLLSTRILRFCFAYSFFPLFFLYPLGFSHHSTF